MVDRAERLVDVQEREVRERRAEDRADADVDRPDREPDRERRDEERDGDEAGAEADAPRLDAGCRLRSCRPSSAISSACAIRATDRANCTIRGPQREATSSSARTTRWCCTAVIVLQPGRAATVAASCPQHFVSARTIDLGFGATMYSAESCG